MPSYILPGNTWKTRQKDEFHLHIALLSKQANPPWINNLITSCLFVQLQFSKPNTPTNARMDCFFKLFYFLSHMWFICKNHCSRGKRWWISAEKIRVIQMHCCTKWPKVFQFSNAKRLKQKLSNPPNFFDIPNLTGNSQSSVDDFFCTLSICFRLTFQKLLRNTWR